MAEINTASYPPPTGPPIYHDDPTYSTEPPPPHQQPPQYQKPYTNVQPLIDQNVMVESPIPTVAFSDESNNTNKADEYSFDAPQSNPSASARSLNLRYQIFLDKIAPHWKARWTFSLVALVVFLARVIISQGWYVICYGLAIYYLNLLIGFISPRVDPGLRSDDDDDDAGPMLPTSASDEFKPFIRRVPEFKFWISGTKATLIALVMTLFDLFDVPVFWPILLIYFIILFACTMRQQIKHMIRYSYVPWDSGKKKYAGSGNDNLSPTTI